MTNHYQIPLPAVVSFSGGRTSGFMLRQILDAYGGQPDGLKIAFQNTGLEAEATLVFVRECSERWSCEIVWLEYLTDAANRPSFKVVNFDTASRSGEPFDAVIDKKKFLPNPVARICTQELKVLTMARWLKTVPGFEESYTNAVGLRADEPRRAIRVLGDNKRDMACPLYRAGITNDDVLTFWAANDFDLELPTSGSYSNCQGCFLKSRARTETLMLDPSLAEHFAWWVAAEAKPLPSAPDGARFRKDRPGYADLLETVRRQGRLPFDEATSGDDTIPCMCTD